MAMKFVRAGSIGGFGALLLAAVGCSAEMTSETQEEALGKTTEAVCGDYNAYVAMCQARCLGGGCDGAAIASCMSSCMAGFCVGPPEPPEPEPEPEPDDCWQSPPEPTQPPQSNCDGVWLDWCYDWCDTCLADDVVSRGVCLGGCMESYCSSSEPEAPEFECPVPPITPQQPGCDTSYLNWCNSWCTECGDPGSDTICRTHCQHDYCPNPVCPAPPQTTQQPGCDENYLNWCNSWCEVCAQPEDRVGCHGRCTWQYCSTEPACAETVSGTCSAECDWDPDFAGCLRRCTARECGGY